MDIRVPCYRCISGFARQDSQPGQATPQARLLCMPQDVMHRQKTTLLRHSLFNLHARDGGMIRAHGDYMRRNRQTGVELPPKGPMSDAILRHQEDSEVAEEMEREQSSASDTLCRIYGRYYENPKAGLQ